jgi:hypothetical protein
MMVRPTAILRTNTVNSFSFIIPQTSFLSSLHPGSPSKLEEGAWERKEVPSAARREMMRAFQIPSRVMAVSPR